MKNTKKENITIAITSILIAVIPLLIYGDKTNIKHDLLITVIGTIFLAILMKISTHSMKKQRKMEWEKKQRKQQTTEPQQEEERKPFTQADFERWKQDRGGYIDLEVLVGLLRSRSV